MKRFLTVVAGSVAAMLVASGLAWGYSASGIKPEHLFRGKWVFRVGAGDTTTNDKIIDAQNAAGTSKFSADIEGDVSAAGTMFSAGNFSVGSGVFAVTASNGNLASSGTGSFGGAITGPRAIISAASGSTNLTAAQSGSMVLNTGTTSTTTFVLPGAAAGLWFCFIEAGDAGGSILINPATGDAIKAKATVDGAQIAPAAGTGIVNTAGTNTVSDSICLVATDTTNWRMTSISGTWASQ